MARIVVLGSGFAGHTCALNLRKGLSKEHEVIVVTPQKKFGYIPSFVWVGTGSMDVNKTQFELAPVYAKQKITYVNALAFEIHPDEQYVKVKEIQTNSVQDISYDYLVNATGPKLNFAATQGLGPDNGYSYSICTPTHAQEAGQKYLALIDAMKQGKKQKIVIGTGHGMCTCQGAAFEYIHNIAFDLEKRGLSDMAEITWISNEQALGDFGVGGMVLKKGGYEVSGKIFAESSFVERGIEWVVGAHTTKVEPGRLEYKTIEGVEGVLEFDFSMLIPPFAGVDMKYIDKNGKDITAELCAPNNMLKVDADYSSASKPFEQWGPKEWPNTYQNQSYKNMFAAGIAFAPPHPISKPAKTPDGTPVVATPPRTGMVAGITGSTVAKNIIDLVKGKEMSHKASMGEFGAACVASMGNCMNKGSAAAIVMYPVIPNYEKYKTGRDNSYTFGDMGLAGHWIKVVLHHMFIYKMKAKPFWSKIPD